MNHQNPSHCHASCFVWAGSGIASWGPGAALWRMHPGCGGLTREEAREHATIARRRAYAYRAQSEALRHHCDVLLAIWDPNVERQSPLFTT